MEITKAQWASKDGRVSLSMPFSKVDQEQRTVSGYASLNNLDSQNDIVTAACAKDAFDRFRGNIREMHQPIAVGKILSFWQQPYYDQETDATYVGVYVTAYVSTGAQDTWQKVLDGTLTGFSIGGVIVDQEEIFDSTNDSIIRMITRMDLSELSLVDNPANQLANIVSIQKVVSDDGQETETISGIAVDVKTESVYWCGTDKVSLLGDQDAAPSCVKCHSTMEEIGWVEAGEHKVESMKKVVHRFISAQESNLEISKGGVDDMEDQIENVEKAVEDSAEPIEEVVAEVEKDAAEEVDHNAVLLEDFKNIVTEEMAKVSDETAKAAGTVVENAIAEVTKSFDSKIEALEATISTLKSDLEDAKAEFSGVAKRMDAVESETAVKKSGELGREPDQIKKSLWAGSFLTAEEL